MNELLTALFKNILSEASVKGVRMSSKGQRLVNFDSEENLRKRIQKSGEEGITYRTYNPQTDSHLTTGKDAPAQQPPKQRPATDSRKSAKKVGSAPASQTYEPWQSTPGMSPAALEASTSIYGSDSDGPLLQGDDSDAQMSIDYGYVEGATWVAPGNPGSCFNEQVSNEGVLILTRYPDLTEQELAEVLFERTKATPLGEQQTKVSGVSAPKHITDKKQKEIFKNCVLAARSARSKYVRSVRGVAALKETGKFSGETRQETFGGTTRNKTQLISALESAKAIYVYDDDLGIIEIPKEEIVAWAKSSGGGENAADTVVLTVDSSGNVLYDGWSDKKSLDDIQANSTLKNEFAKAQALLDTVCKGDTPRAGSDECQRASTIIQNAASRVDDIEAGYADLTAQMAGYFIDLPAERLNVLGQAAAKWKGSGREPGTQKHFKKFSAVIDKFLSGKMKSGPAKKPLEEFFSKNPELRDVPEEERAGVYFKALVHLGSKGLLGADYRKIIDRMAVREKSEMRESGTEIPATLETSAQLSALRKQAFDVQKETMQSLHAIPAKSSSGKSKTLGELIGFEDAMQALHLDKINLPTEGRPDIRQTLRRNTQLVMGGVAVTPRILRDCLQSKNTSEIEDNFELVFEERLRYSDDEKTKVSGKVVVIYAVSKEGNKIEIGERTYRPKDGPTSPTATTVTWSGNMQDCFESKST